MNASPARFRSIFLAICALCASVARPLSAAPVIDGERDAEYTLIASSPADNLLVDTARGINDPADPRANALDAANFWAANTRTDLFLYVEMPHLDLNAIAGEWAVLFHLRGANDAIAQTGFLSDPYGASVDFRHVPALNAILKSNARGYLADFDGNQGWAFLNATNKATTDWSWDNSNFLGGAGWTDDHVNDLIHGAGNTGGEIVYKARKGIEVKIPLSLFADNAGATNMTPLKPGDTVLMQFYDNVRERGTPRYPRGPIDCVPFEAASRTDPYRGAISQWASYTLIDAGIIEVRSVRMKDITDAGHLVVGFSGPVGAGAAVPSSYSIVNEGTGEAIPVSAAQVDSGDSKRVILTAALPANAKLMVKASGVRGAGGEYISAILNGSEVSIGTAVTFHLYDPYGAVSSLGNDPKTGQPYKVTLTGDMIGWRNTADGSTEIAMNPDPQRSGHLISPAIYLTPGVLGYKYRVPGLPDWDNWNSLNPHDRRFYVPAAPSAQTADNAAGPVKNGGPVRATFTLVDRNNVAKGRAVYLTGQFLDWSTDPSVAIPMPAVPGKPNTYSAAFDLPAGNGGDTTTYYKYILKPDAASALMNDLNPYDVRWVTFKGSGTPATQSIVDVLAIPGRAKILGAAGGLDPVPAWSDTMAEMDADQNGVVTLKDTARLSRLKTKGIDIVDPAGHPVILRGINLGGWFVEEMWMTPWVQDPPSGSPYPKVQDHMSLWSVLTQRLGVTGAQNVRATYRNSWVRPSDLRRIREAGFNCVRLPFIYDLLDEPNGIDWLRRAVSMANNAGLYVILDMHGAPGSQNGWDHSGQVGGNTFFTDPANIAKAVQVWTTLAQEFGSNPGVAGCDLLNEPAGAPDATTLHQVHNQLYQAIRKVAPETMVFIEDGYKGFDTIPPTSTYGWSNVVYSTHLYNFEATSPEYHLNALYGQLPWLRQVRADRNVPAYIGEFNLEPNNSPEATAIYTRKLTENGFAWSVWTYKTVARGGPMGFWGYVSNPAAVNALNPFTDTEATLVSKLSQVRTENLAVPAGLEPVYHLPD